MIHTTSGGGDGIAGGEGNMFEQAGGSGEQAQVLPANAEIATEEDQSEVHPESTEEPLFLKKLALFYLAS